MKTPEQNDRYSQTGLLGTPPPTKMNECSERGLECGCTQVLITLRDNMRQAADLVIHLHHSYTANTTENELDHLSYFLLWRLGQLVTNQ